ncbi:helix-turn-helix domain-containing protein [Actinomadura sp. HBU206391]|uniref:helix-turn-helix domain-containing protein n=1 Tax=Actinomadura sp. HBU206391 TaxID=2731692 RepID=UPI00164F9A65|nr:Scr1 family TA system antitoxin-like transcriptional regulator [Actinomadura sp. HBU206391]MBC6461837.1 helix-turn-helix transcriptional regulator [Actinomadura sp. HBU206391]
MPPGERPSFRFRRIGETLRVIRQENGWTLETAGRVLDRSAASLSAIENGLQPIRPRDLKHILDEYGVTDPARRDPLLALAGQGRQKGWWHTFEQRLSPTTLDFASLESDATAIRSFELHVVPGLLQTREYATKVIGGSGVELRTSRAMEIEIDFRMARQRILTGTRPPQLSTVIGEAALRQMMGDQATMRRQLDKLLVASRLPHVHLQVLPFASGSASRDRRAVRHHGCRPGTPSAGRDRT